MFFITYLFLCLFLNKIQKNINCEWQKSKANTKDKQVHVTKKKLSEETEQNPTEPNHFEVITLLDRCHLAILFEVYP